MKKTLKNTFFNVFVMNFNVCYVLKKNLPERTAYDVLGRHHRRRRKNRKKKEKNSVAARLRERRTYVAETNYADCLMFSATPRCASRQFCSSVFPTLGIQDCHEILVRAFTPTFPAIDFSTLPSVLLVFVRGVEIYQLSSLRPMPKSRSPFEHSRKCRPK